MKSLFPAAFAMAPASGAAQMGKTGQPQAGKAQHEPAATPVSSMSGSSK